jgi:hypothetical protein
VALDQREVNIKSIEYKYIILHDIKAIYVPSPSGMHAGMKRHYYFKQAFSDQYHVSIISTKIWDSLKIENEIKILKIKEIK